MRNFSFSPCFRFEERHLRIVETLLKLFVNAVAKDGEKTHNFTGVPYLLEERGHVRIQIDDRNAVEVAGIDDFRSQLWAYVTVIGDHSAESFSRYCPRDQDSR